MSMMTGAATRPRTLTAEQIGRARRADPRTPQGRALLTALRRLAVTELRGPGSVEFVEFVDRRLAAVPEADAAARTVYVSPYFAAKIAGWAKSPAEQARDLAARYGGTTTAPTDTAARRLGAVELRVIDRLTARFLYPDGSRRVGVDLDPGDLEQLGAIVAEHTDPADVRYLADLVAAVEDREKTRAERSAQRVADWHAAVPTLDTDTTRSLAAAFAPHVRAGDPDGVLTDAEVDARARAWASTGEPST